ncbi:hypothetical protein VdG2_07739 [Verticillium dahliae VDG2]|nr:hypothetical protein VdG2_07739 [Verticillium dahliae VDG2]
MRLSLVPALFGVLADAVPTEEQAASHREDKRQLGSLLGIFNRDATFDYVIIGGGTAGLTLANRLSANRDMTVAVVEAGSFYQITNPALGQTPAGDTLFAGSSPSDTNPLVDWNFVTEPQAGAGNRTIHYARGKCLGGSSARNFMVYQRGTKQSYQNTWLEPALNELGVAEADDFNSGALLGAQYCASTIDPRTQTRDSSQTSFLRDAQGRSNLKVYTATLARRISPQLLMVSGVGPRAQLSKLGIPVVADRPGVGQTMEDHVFFGPTHRVNVQTLTRLANDLLYTGAQFLGPYALQKQGPLTNPVCDYLGWEKIPRALLPASAASTLDAAFPPDWPELEYISAPGYVGAFTNLLTTQPRDGYQYATILGALVAPLSRGTVTLRSADTRDLPLINPNWLTDPTDVAVAVATYKRLRAAFATDAMKGVLVGGGEYFPGAAVQTDAQILNTIRETVMTVWHAACTCRMGKRDDPMAVVDSDAKVIGVQGLRVVDASSFALLPPGHPQSTVYVLAEKIAAEILEAL